MNRLTKLFAAAIFFLLFPVSLFSWNALGHMVIAKIAYDNLKPNVRERIDKLVNSFHYEYADMGSFTQLAIWPDSIRSQKIEAFVHWHYIDIPFSKDGSALKNTVDTDNAVWALENTENVVKNARANTYERARFLAFLVHIVGDVHQPLHTVTHISASHPDGDKGGNLYEVKYQNEKTNLHKLWDNGLGLFSGPPTPDHASKIAKNLMTAYPKSSYGKQINDLNPNNWVKEGMDNAKNYVYSISENHSTTPAYIDAGKKVVEKEVVLAGYRVAELINQLLKN